ncbi:MAG: hypothetical protein HQK53_17920 [Oligoflexia bacterium]|nr:hypothetical protein [Oligoflexia bacterium]
MTIDFGKVERYIENRGFGFVSHTFAKMPPKEVFFHIKVVKRTHPNLSQVLYNTSTNANIYFWYEYETSPKGQEVLAILNPNKIRQKYDEHIAVLIDTIKTYWMNAGKPLPEAIRKATSDLLTSDEANHLAASREILEAEQKRHQEELQKAEDAKLKAIADQRAARENAENEEFRQLVAEMSALKFTSSSQVSNYIVRNRLGYNYKHISGILEMELDDERWKFNGGIQPKIYARLCEELGLGNQRSLATPVAFTAYKDIIDH